MARTKKVEEKEVATIHSPEPIVEVKAPVVQKIVSITEHFGNGDLNVLRDKINEIIRSI